MWKLKKFWHLILSILLTQYAFLPEDFFSEFHEKKVEFIAYTLFSLSIISLEQKIQFPRKSSGISKSPPKLSRTRDDIKLRLLKN